MLYVKTPRVVLWFPVNHRLYLVQISARFFQVAVCFRTGRVVFWNETRKTVSESEPQNSPMIKRRSVWSYWEEVDDREKMSSWKLRKNIRWYDMIHICVCMCVCVWSLRSHAVPKEPSLLRPNTHILHKYVFLSHIRMPETYPLKLQRALPEAAESISNHRKSITCRKMKQTSKTFIAPNVSI